MVVKIVYDELVNLLGEKNIDVNLKRSTACANDVSWTTRFR